MKKLVSILTSSTFSVLALGCGSSGSSGSPAAPLPDASAHPQDGSPGGGRDSSANSDSAVPPETDSSTADSSTADSTTGTDASMASHAIKTIFLIMMENTNWSTVTSDTNATYINGTLVPNYAHATNYGNPGDIHPSEPNYIWLEAGSNLNITSDSDPGTNHQSTTSHLVTQLSTAGVTWKAYVENITGGTCPLTSSGLFGCKHTPMLFFDDVTNTNSPSAPICVQNVVPYTNLANDLTNNTVARYNFITPNLCDDMHNSGCTSPDPVVNGDTWLSTNIPPILASQAYQNGGVILIVWDEETGSSGTAPIGAIVLSPLIKSKGYSNAIAYSHSSTLKTVEEVFGVPLLRGAADSATEDLSDFFTSFP